MTTTHTVDKAAAAKTAVRSVLLLLVWAGGTGLLIGLFLVHLLGWLGLHVDSGTGNLLHRAFLP